MRSRSRRNFRRSLCPPTVCVLVTGGLLADLEPVFLTVRASVAVSRRTGDGGEFAELQELEELDEAMESAGGESGGQYSLMKQSVVDSIFPVVAVSSCGYGCEEADAK